MINTTKCMSKKIQERNFIEIKNQCQESHRIGVRWGALGYRAGMIISRYSSLLLIAKALTQTPYSW